MNITCRFTGQTEQLLKRLQQLSHPDTAGANRAIAEALRSGTVERFNQTRSPEGPKWKSSIRAAESGGKTLTKTAGLKNSIRAEGDRDGLAVGTNSIYAATHQFGANGRVIRPKRAKMLRFQVHGKWVMTKKVTVNIPARPFLGVSEDDEDEIRGILDDMMEGG